MTPLNMIETRRYRRTNMPQQRSHRRLQQKQYSDEKTKILSEKLMWIQCRKVWD